MYDKNLSNMLWYIYIWFTIYKNKDDQPITEWVLKIYKIKVIILKLKYS